MFIVHVGLEFKVVLFHINGLTYAKQCLVVFLFFMFNFPSFTRAVVVTLLFCGHLCSLVLTF